jgi:hypothetical protein
MTIEEARKEGEIYEKWFSIGFLENVENSLLLDLSLGLENLAKILLADCENSLGRKFNDETATKAFPVLYRIKTRNPKTELTNKFLNELLNKLYEFTESEDYINAMNLYGSDSRIDIEAELLSEFTENNYDI